MNPVIHLLVELQRRGIELRPDGDRIAFRPRRCMTADLRALLAEHKAELLEVLRSAPELGLPYQQPVPLSILELVARTEGACYACGCLIFWRPPTGKDLVCAVCHPPGRAPGELEWNRGGDAGGHR
jgi:hypothetical protein